MTTIPDSLTARYTDTNRNSQFACANGYERHCKLPNFLGSRLYNQAVNRAVGPAYTYYVGNLAAPLFALELQIRCLLTVYLIIKYQALSTPNFTFQFTRKELDAGDVFEVSCDAVCVEVLHI